MAVVDEHVRVAQQWAGQEGFQRFRQLGDWVVPDPRLFRADWHAVSVDGVQLAEWRSTPFSGRPLLDDPGTVRLDVVVGGRLQYGMDDAVHVGEPGSVHLVHSGRPLQVSSPSGMRVARVTLSDESIPLWLRGSAPVPDGPLPSTTLTTGFVALLDRLTAVIRDDPDQPPLTTARAVGVLVTALLEEAVPSGSSSPGDLREQILSFIDRHLGDADLGPAVIADEFGVSLRWVHRVFNRGDESIARYIRERRVDAIAHQLRTDRRWVRVTDLAARFGFAGRDQLTRAFKQRYGMTVADYLDLAVRERPLPQPPTR